MIDDYEERYISAYCRLSFEIWYQGYTEDISNYTDSYTMFEKLDHFAAHPAGNRKTIKIDGTKQNADKGLEVCIRHVLGFLSNNEEWSVIIALPYELHPRADCIAYEETTFQIERQCFYKEQLERAYVFQLYRRTLKIEKYLNILSDKTVSYFICYEDRVVKREGIAIDIRLYNELYNWAKKYAIDLICTDWDILEGMGICSYNYCELTFNLVELGIKNPSLNVLSDLGNYMPSSKSMLKLFNMEELKEFAVAGEKDEYEEYDDEYDEEEIEEEEDDVY